MTPLKLEIPSLSENIRIVESFIDNAKEKLDFNDDIYGNILVAVTEAVNNAIIHGNKNNKDKNVHLSIQVENSNIIFEVADEGDGFDPNNLPDPTAPENIENIGGRGIFLIKNLVDEIEFKEDGRRIKMVFYV